MSPISVHSSSRDLRVVNKGSPRTCEAIMKTTVASLIWKLNDVAESTEARVIMRALLAYVLKVYLNDRAEHGGGHMAHRTRFVFFMSFG